ncbi:hypothetical protein KM043_002862 [Ampulex compressa]|nr:hypothetical protein KM043_002862 [Ampulex compressa]
MGTQGRSVREMHVNRQEGVRLDEEGRTYSQSDLPSGSATRRTEPEEPSPSNGKLLGNYVGETLHCSILVLYQVIATYMSGPPGGEDFRFGLMQRACIAGGGHRYDHLARLSGLISKKTRACNRGLCNVKTSS